MSVTHIKTSESIDIYKELLVALGSENNPNQWLEFMTVMRSRLPFLIGGTKPTKAHYDNSIIGALGFKSWAEMVRAPLEANGFNWSVNTWKKWSHAYSIVLANPYLRDANMSPFQILKLKATFKEDLPDDLESLEQAQADIIEQKAKDKADSIAELKALVSELKSAIVIANAKLDVFEAKKSENELLSLKLDNVGKTNTRLAVELTEQREINDTLYAELASSIKEVKELKNMSRLKCLKRVFSW